MSMVRLTKKEAEKTALAIKKYWEGKGKNVCVWTVNMGRSDFAVRSDMFNGKPRE